jgi:CRP-like cAMP-binding protein
MTGDHFRRNRILNLLPPAEAEKLAPHFTHVSLQFKEPLATEGKPIEEMYFVLSGVVSLVVPLDGEDPVEAGTVGFEGVVGLPAYLGQPVAPWRALCQLPGEALKVDPQVVIERATQGSLGPLLLRYTTAVISMMAQGAACNRVHPLEERMSRWLLMTHDRMGTESFPLTQEFLGQMLGVRRPSVSIAGSTLQKAGLIKYSRGRITIVDRAGLETASCECYRVIRDQYEIALNGKATVSR